MAKGGKAPFGGSTKVNLPAPPKGGGKAGGKKGR